MTNSTEVIQIFLDEESEELNRGLLRIPCDTVVEFILPNQRLSMLQVGFVLETTCPTSENVEYRRDTMHDLVLESHTDTFERVGRLNAFLPGAYKYQVKHHNKVLEHTRGRFIVEPRASINGVELPLSAMVMQTVLTKCLGPVEEWVGRLLPSAQTGYNFVHFTPVQELGISNSCYSIYDQLTIAPSIVPDEKSNEVRVKLLTDCINTIEEKLYMLSLTDIVLNHTANNTPWLQEHPEAAYTSLNCPHLHAAIELEDAMLELSKELGSIEDGQVLKTEQHLKKIMDTFTVDFLPKYKLWEYFVLDMDCVETTFADAYPSLVSFPNPEDFDGLKEAVRPGVLPTRVVESLTQDEFIQLIITRAVRATANVNNPRRSWSLKVPALVTILRDRFLSSIPDYGAFLCWDAVKLVAETVNLVLYRRYDQDISAAVKAIESTARFEWLEKNPPRGGGTRTVGASLPLVDPYFTRIAFRNGDVVAFANNGFIWGGNPLDDFGAPGPLGPADPSCPYFRRELVIWGDCVKLRYGKGPGDSPWLWSHMRQYVEQMAGIFHGFRIDNAHGTPKHVAADMLDCARRVRPHLIVQAELFTGSESLDVDYVSDLGFNMLIREAMQAPDPRQLADLIYRHGGRPVASLRAALDSTALDSTALALQDTAPFAARRLPVVFFDCTHDNETPTQKRTAEDSLSNAVLVAMSNCAVGSVRGYDDLVPKNPSVVAERRCYGTRGPGWHAPHSLAAIKRFVNVLHVSMARRALDEIHVEHVPLEGEESLVVVTRSNSKTGQSVVAICRPAFKRLDSPAVKLPEVVLDGHFLALGIAASLKVWQQSLVNFEKDDEIINGLAASFHVQHSFPCDFANFVPVYNTDAGNAPITKVSLDGKVFSPGSAIVLQSSVFDRKLAFQKGHHEPLASYAEPKLNPDGIPVTWGGNESRNNGDVAAGVLSRPSRDLHDLVPGPAPSADGKAAKLDSKLARAQEALGRLSLSEINILLFCCEGEERDRTHGKHGTYGVPGWNNLYYAGLAGAYAQLRQIAIANDMGHPLLENVRQGDWLLEHQPNRLPSEDERFQSIAEWMRATFAIAKGVASSVRPLLAFRLVKYVWDVVTTSVFARMSPFVRNGSSLARKLALTSVILVSHVPSAPLLRLDDSRLARIFQSGKVPKASLAAGLTHFATNFMRNWGRDTFIALRGLLLVTGRWQVARDTLLSYACTVRHGLVPNLMDGGSRPRYNARDATWFFLQALQDYCELKPPRLHSDGSEDFSDRYEILRAPVNRLFPHDRWEEHRAWANRGREPAVVQPLHEIVQEILHKHASGIRFREWFAGPSLDECMSDPGFEVAIHWDSTTGLLFGGNERNCGTWMDKMGSVPGVNRGNPATPRDGAPIEITALLKSTLSWLCQVHARHAGSFPHTSVTTEGTAVSMSYRTWAATIQENFEWKYFVPSDPVQDKDFDVNPGLVGKRGMYKDVCGSRSRYCDYQLRPNLLIAMTVAPELFQRDRARRALTLVESALVSTSQLGVKTLDSADWAYRGVYDNANHSEDESVAGGINYHQGPEWLWPLGYYLRARLRFFFKKSSSQQEPVRNQMSRFVRTYLRQHERFIDHGREMGLPELTNENSQHCPFSCEVQAWSSSTLLDALYDLKHLDELGIAPEERKSSSSLSGVAGGE